MRVSKKQWAISVTDDTLRDTGKLLEWLKVESRTNAPRARDTEHDRIRVIAAAERALEVGDKPTGLFIHLITNGLWNRITQAQEDRAVERLRRWNALQRYQT